jgi:uncharacterized protein involved in exopolysaccharide biosynthesis
MGYLVWSGGDSALRFSGEARLVTNPGGSSVKSAHAPSVAGHAGGDGGSQLSPVGLFNLLLRQRWLIALCATVVFALAVGTKLLAPRTYTASSIFMPQSRSSLPSLSGLAAQFGLAMPGAEPSQSPAFYASLAKTRQILSAVAAGRYASGEGEGASRPVALAELLKVNTRNDSLRRLQVIDKLERMVGANVSLTTGVVMLDVTSRYPLLSEQLNRRILELLNNFNMETRQSRAKQEREFTERRIVQVATELRESEDRLQGFLQRNRDYRNSPELTFQQDRLAREVSMRQQVYTTLVQALEQAKIEEVRDTPLITIVQAPEVPARPDPRGLTKAGLLALVAGCILGALLALMREAVSIGVAKRDGHWIELVELANASVSDLRHPVNTLRRIFRPGRDKTGHEIAS